MRGFTLIEILIALVVLAATGLALSSAIGNVAFQTWSLERRTAAHWVAENHLARAQLNQLNNSAPLEAGRHSETVVLSRRRWRVRQSVAETSHPLFWRVEIEVSELVDNQEIGPLGRLVGFVGRH
ncbi:MAG: type II secretion system minor pseudopilin GspI [Gammaproteobacteria bacterium]|nr:type II secretion system minor pseudopilin GspI [Gammaproteobacteria bacterium]